MVALLCFFLTLLASPFKSKSRLEAENAALRHQLIVLRRKVCGRVYFTNSDRLFFVQLYRWVPVALRAVSLIRPEKPAELPTANWQKTRSRGSIGGSQAAPSVLPRRGLDLQRQ